MLSVSYVVAAAAMCAAAIYLFLRLRPFVTTATMLIAALLLIYGPAALSFTLSSGESALLIHRLLGTVGTLQPIFPKIKAKVSDFDAVIIAMNFSIALMYVGTVAGIETVDRLFPKRTTAMRAALANWNVQPLADDAPDHRLLLIVISAVALLMMTVSIRENHIGTIWHFFSIRDDNDARNLYRLHFGDTPNYPYRIVLAAVAPMFVIWGLLAGALSRSWVLLLAAFLLLLATMVGKLETLSKAPPAFFLVQLALAGLLAFTNRISWRVGLLIVLVVALVLFAITSLVMVFPDGTVIYAVYSRVFEAESQSLLENFATFPAIHPHMWGANIRPIAALMGLKHIPAYSIVAYTWYGTYDVTSPSLFIADAWADFGYAGVILFSVAAGVICRGIDLAFLTHGKSVVCIAVLGATFLGVLTLLITALNTALFSGGLLLAPILAGMLVTITRRLTPAAPLRKQVAPQEDGPGR